MGFYCYYFNVNHVRHAHAAGDPQGPSLLILVPQGKERDPFLGRPRPPRYKDRDGEITIRFPRNHISHRRGRILLPKKVGRYQIRHKLPEGADVKMVRIIPRESSYVAEIVYGKEINVNNKVAGCVLGVDIGLENLMTVVDD